MVWCDCAVLGPSLVLQALHLSKWWVSISLGLFGHPPCVVTYPFRGHHTPSPVPCECTLCPQNCHQVTRNSWPWCCHLDPSPETCMRTQCRVDQHASKRRGSTFSDMSAEVKISSLKPGCVILPVCLFLQYVCLLGGSVFMSALVVFPASVSAYLSVVSPSLYLFLSVCLCVCRLICPSWGAGFGKRCLEFIFECDSRCTHLVGVSCLQLDMTCCTHPYGVRECLQLDMTCCTCISCA